MFVQQRQLLASNSGLEEKHRSKIASLEKQLEQSIEARNRRQEESSIELAEARAFYEKELESLKSLQNTSNEERYNQLQKQFEDFRKCTSDAELKARQQTEDLTNRLLLAEDLSSDLTTKCSGLQQLEVSYRLEINSLQQKVCFCLHE